MSCKSRIASCLALLVALSVGCEKEGAQDPTRPASQPTSQPQAKVPPPPSEFARFVRVGEDEGRFDVAITTYQNDAKQRVSLIAAVHIADAKHYQELQREFEGYDAVLYELVASAEDRPKPGEPRPGGGGVLSVIQRMMKSGLEMEFQLDAVDYTVDNFVHADLTPQAFAEKMEERGETFMTIFFRLLQQEMAMMKKMQEEQFDEEGERRPQPSFDLVSAFRKGEGRHLLRMKAAEMLQNVEMLAAGVDPDNKEEGTVLLEGRNERALEVLEEQLGKGRDNLAIYYGAAHMSGIEHTLLEDMGFEKVGHRWLVAWDISKRPDPVRERK